jgi:hypothetical protein
LVEEQYEKIVAVLNAQSWDDDLFWQPHGEATIRDFLRRLVARLDALRPWQEPPVRSLGFDRWNEFKHGTLLAHVRLGPPSQDVLNARLRPVPGDPEGSRGDVLRLRSGDEVALMAPPFPDGYRGTLMAAPPHRPVDEVIAAFVTHTGYERKRVSPAVPAVRRRWWERARSR